MNNKIYIHRGSKGKGTKKGRILPNPITEEELNLILKATKMKHHKSAFALAFYQCLRVSEVVNLKEQDIKRDTKLLYIKQAKGHKDRHIPIAQESVKYLRNIPIGCGIRALQKAWNRITMKVLGKPLNFHILRHSGITYYIVKKKWSSLNVQRMAGHSKIATTELYTHINPTDLVELMWGEGK